MNRNIVNNVVFWGVSVLPVVGAAASVVEVTRLDGTTFSATLVAVTPGELIFESDERIAVGHDAVREIRFESPTAPESAAPGGAVFHFAAGGRMAGSITGEGDESVLADTPLGDNVKLPLAALSGIWFGSDDSDARAMFDAALADRLAGRDVLITRRGDRVTAIRGSVTALGPEGGRIVLNRSERPFSLSRIRGIVFAVGILRNERWPVLTRMADGTEFSARLVGGDGGSLEFDTSAGFPVTLPLQSILVMRFASDRIVYLSDLNPSGERSVGLIGSPLPARFDRSAGNGPIAIGGRRFAKGVGVRADSTLTYELNGEYETFVATLGIDDAVRPRGSVVCRIEGDGRKLYESAVVTGTDPPTNVVVDVAGVSVLSLVVDHGPDLDISDHADWADARLIKPEGE